jgi:nitrous oxidase accessory protein NosD
MWYLSKVKLLNKLKTIGTTLLIILLTTTLLLYQGALIVRASTIRVPEDYATIQSAIDHASPGDIITVKAGVYSGFKVTKSLTIMGESNQTVVVKDSVEVDANNVKVGSLKIILEESTGSSTALKIMGNNTNLVGVIIESYKDAVQLGTVDHEISGTLIEYSKIKSGQTGIFGACKDLAIFYSEVESGGLAIAPCNYLDLEFSRITGDTAVSSSLWSMGFVIRNNYINGKSTGIYLDGDQHTISNNVITGGGGIALGARGVIIENNTISTSGTGIAVTKENNVIIRNTISSGGYAIELAGNGNMILNNTLTGSRGVNVKTGYGNTIAFNLIYETGTVGVYFSKYTGDNLVYGNTFWYCYNYEAADESGKNQWYLENETHKLGNYWSYNKAPDNNGDGITDEPYHIGTTTGLEIIDKYPLAQPLVSPYQTPPTTTSTQPPQTTPSQTTTQVETESSKTQTTTPITTPSSGVYTSSTTQETSGLINTWYIVASAIGVVFILAILFILLRARGKP